MNKVVSIASGLVATGGVGAGVIYFSTNNSQKPNAVTNPAPVEEKVVVTKTKKAISEWLKSEQKTLIVESEDENAIWKPKWAIFKGKYTDKAPDGAWKIEKWSTAQKETEGLKEFKKLCTKNGSEEIEDKAGELYEQVKEFCTK